MADVIHVSFSGSVNNNDWVNGVTGTDEMMGQTFIPTATILCPKVILVFSNESANTDDVTLRIETTSGGLPTGTLADANASAVVNGTTFSSYAGQANSRVTWAFATPFYLSVGVQYAIVVKRAGAWSSNAYAWLIRTLGGYDDGKYVSRNSGTWGDGSEGGDALFEVYERQSDVTTSIKDLIGHGKIPSLR